MAWVRLDDQIARNPKLVAAGPEAAWLWVCAIAYCSSSLTDGYVDVMILSSICTVRRPKALARRLVDVGLFELVEGGYRVHDYLEHNATREEILRKRASDARRKRTDSARTPRGIRAESRGTPAALSSPLRTSTVPERENARGIARGHTLSGPDQEHAATSAAAVWEAWRGVSESAGVPCAIVPTAREIVAAEVLAASYALEDLAAAMRYMYQSGEYPLGKCSLGMFRANAGQLIAACGGGRLVEVSEWRCVHDPHCGARGTCERRSALEAARRSEVAS